MTTEPTDAEIIALADEARAGEPGRDGYILPISFARAVLQRWGQPSGAGEPVAPEQMDALEALAKRHGALSYRNRADTQNPAFGFSVAGLESLLAEVRKEDTELIRQMRDALALPCDRWNATQSRIVREAIDAADAWLEGKP